jgi:hypothetical protein
MSATKFAEMVERNRAERRRVDDALPAFRDKAETYHPQMIASLYCSMEDAARSARTDSERYSLNQQMSILADVYAKKTGRSIIFAT